MKIERFESLKSFDKRLADVSGEVLFFNTVEEWSEFLAQCPADALSNRGRLLIIRFEKEVES